MITFNVSGTKVAIPSSWDEVNLIQYCEILKGTPSEDKLLSIFTGIDCETLKNSVIIGLDQVLITLSFIRKVPTVNMPSKVGQFEIKNPDIKFESLAMFEDMKSIMVKSPKDISGFTRNYASTCALYLQKQRDGVYSFEKAMAMVPEIEQYPALEVIGLGSFFLTKLINLTSGIVPSSPSTTQSRKKSKPVMKNSKKRSVPTGRSRKRR